MHPDELLDALKREAAELAATLDGDLDVTVPSCPEWTLGTLVNHIGRVHRWATANVRAGGDAAPFPGRGDTIDRAYFEAGVDDLVAALEEAEPDAPAWNHIGVQPVARFWMRRQAHETAIHRWDAQGARAAGQAAPVDTELALDGIDELLDVLATRGYQGDDLGGTLHLHATDSPHGEWLIRTIDGDLLVGHDHQKGDAAVRGTASDLLLWLWGRLPLDGDDRFEVFGDRAVAERLRQVLKAP